MSYYDSSTLTKRRQNKVIANNFITRINQQHTTSYGPLLGISDSSILSNVVNGQMKYINKCDGAFNVDTGCPCIPSTNQGIPSVIPPLLNWPAFIVGNDDTASMLSVSYSVSDDGQRVYITGLFSGTVNLYRGGVTDTTSEPWIIQLVTATTLYDGFIACYSTSGQVLWATAIETRSPGTITQGFSITDDSTGVYVTGIFGDYINPTTPPSITTTIDLYNGITSGVFNGTGPADATLDTVTTGSQRTNLAQFLVKYDTNGIVQWVTKIDNYSLLTQPTEPKGLQYSICTNGTNVFITGNFFVETTLYTSGISSVGSAEYQFQPLPTPSNFLTLLACYKSNGQFLWATYQTGTISFGTGLSCDANNVYVTGYFGGTIDYYDTTIGKVSPTPLNSQGQLINANSGAFIMVYGVSGTSISWIAQALQTAANNGSSLGQSISVDSTGMYVSVQFSDSLDVYDGTPTGPSGSPVTISNSVITPPEASVNYAIIKYNLSGTIAWIQQINNIGDTTTGIPYLSFGSSLSSDGNGVYFASTYNQPIDIFTTATSIGPGPTSVALSPVTSNQTTDAYLLKYNTAGTLQWMTIVGGISAQNGNAVVSNGTNVYLTGLGVESTDFYDANGTSQPITVRATMNPSPSPAPFSFVAKYNTNGQMVD
jgi:hypothetical protein